MNKALVSGNLGQDPEIRSTNSGMAVGNLSVATNERVKKGEQWEDHTEWHRVVVFGKTAENCGKFLHKGDKVLVEGKLRTKKWTDKAGVEKYTTEIVADNVEFLSTKGGGAGEQKREEPAGERGARTLADSDIPF